MTWLYVLIFIVSCFFLVVSGAWTVKALSRIARFLKWSEFMVAFVLMAFVSSLPELFIGISSAFHGMPEISFGNIIGANVINLTLAVGLAVLFLGGLDIERKTVRNYALFAVVAALLPLILILDGQLSRTDGLILLLAFAGYFFWLFSKRERFSRVYNNARHGFKQFFKDILIFLVSVGLLLLSAELVINSAVVFAQALRVPAVIIGILLIGAGTALPEAYFSIRAALRGRKEMILGNLMGCVVATSLLVLGLVALLSPIKISDFSPYFIARLFLFVSAVFFLIFIRTNERITKKEALFLLLIYFAFVGSEILFNA